MEQLAELVDESAYDLRSWVQSLLIMGHWLDARSLSLSMKQLAYVCCAAGLERAARSVAASNYSLMQDFLDLYGCEQARKK